MHYRSTWEQLWNYPFCKAGRIHDTLIVRDTEPVKMSQMSTPYIEETGKALSITVVLFLRTYFDFDKFSILYL